ncbi:unnamed protein product [Cercospora beticola]|nr:unnamed protein product [Cercospora beticola]
MAESTIETGLVDSPSVVSMVTGHCTALSCTEGLISDHTPPDSQVAAMIIPPARVLVGESLCEDVALLLFGGRKRVCKYVWEKECQSEEAEGKLPSWQRGPPMPLTHPEAPYQLGLL